MPLFSIMGMGRKPARNDDGAESAIHSAMLPAGTEDEAVELFGAVFAKACPGFTLHKVDAFQVAPPPDLHSI